MNDNFDSFFFHSIFASVGVSNLSSRSSSSDASGSSSMISRTSSDSLKSHQSHESCGSHCLGAIPRNSNYSQHQQRHQSGPSSNQQNAISYGGNSKRSAHHYTNKNRLNDIQNRLPPIKEFRSPTKAPLSSPVHLINNQRLR